MFSEDEVSLDKKRKRITNYSKGQIMSLEFKLRPLKKCFIHWECVFNNAVSRVPAVEITKQGVECGLRVAIGFRRGIDSYRWV